MGAISSIPRIYYAAILILFILSVIVLQLPLFNVLGFEFSAALAPVTGYICGILLLASFRVKNFETLEQLRRFVFHQIVVGFLFALLPFVLGISNALFVRNCSIFDGVKFYLLAVIPAIFFSQALAFLTAIIVTKGRVLLFSFLFLIVFLYTFVPPVLSPQVYSFTPLVGLFPGFTYDETLPLLSRLLPYRLITIAGSVFLFAAALWIWQKKVTLLSREPLTTAKRALPEMLLLAALGPFLLTMFVYSDRIGFSISEKFLENKLGGTYSSEHFTFIYPLGKIQRPTVERIALLSEYYYNELRNSLQLSRNHHISVYLYASAEQKMRLVGSAQTDFSKPWLQQIHLTAGNVERTLKHELVHVLAADFGWSFLRVGRSFGTSEGLAVAAGDELWFDEPLDRAAALLLAVDTSVQIQQLFTTRGFLSNAPSSSYLFAGSFCKYLISTYGIESFKHLYRTNDFEAVYGKSLPDLTAQWKKQLTLGDFREGDSLKAAYYTARPSPLKKECLRAIAHRLAEARALYEEQNYDDALTKTETILQTLPSADAVMLKAQILFSQKRFKEFLRFIALAESLVQSPVSLLPLKVRVGDASWALDSLSQAREAYEFLARTHLSRRSDEICAIRLEALSLLQEQHEWLLLFTHTLDDTTQLQRLSYFVSPLSAYLRGCIYERLSEYRKAEKEFRTALGVRSVLLQHLSLYHLGTVLAADEHYTEALEAFRHALSLAPTDGFKAETISQIKRCSTWSGSKIQ